jgi:hypothetical protein
MVIIDIFLTIKKRIKEEIDKVFHNAWLRQPLHTRILLLSEPFYINPHSWDVVKYALFLG